MPASTPAPFPSGTPPTPPEGFLVAMVRTFLTGKASILFLVFALVLGAAALLLTPREEEPQIVVPMADVFVRVPGATAEEVETLVAAPLERLLWQVAGVEHVYSTSQRDACVATVRFHVGEDREDSLIKLYNTLNKNSDLVPTVVSGWSVKPVEIDDVPIVAVTLWSERYSGFELRRMGEELFQRLAEIPNISGVSIVGGQSREVRVELSPERMAGLHVSPGEIQEALAAADVSVTAGTFSEHNTSLRVTSDSFLLAPGEVGEVVVGVFDARPVYLRDVAEIFDGAAEPVSYSRIGFSRVHASRADMPVANTGDQSFPAVTLALAKKRGTNAVAVAEQILARMEKLRRDVLPAGVHVEVTRDYGATAQDKVGDLIESLGYAIATVVLLLAFTLGRREALVVAVAVPVSFALALFVNYLFGFTINRVTLFALILSLGLVVDDPITNVDNIQRHILRGALGPLEATLTAVREVLPPVIMSTLAIIVSFTPMFFITGMMGPYMGPMAANVPLTVTFSTVCALTIVPWLSYHLLKGRAGKGEQNETRDSSASRSRIGRAYAALLAPFLDSTRNRWLLTGVIVVLLMGSMGLAALRLVPLKMLPFDNKNEFQIVLDMAEGTTLEATDRAVRDFESFLRTVPEVTNFVTFAGTASPMDFNGMVRHYYVRAEPNQADIRVNLAHKTERAQQSHAIVLRLRNDLQAIADRHAARMKIVEVPPGPPVLSTITAELYGGPDRSYGQLVAAGKHLQKIMAAEPGVVDIDGSEVADHVRVEYEIDKEKAALHGVDTEEILAALALALGGASPANVHAHGERQPLPVRLVLPRARRSSMAALTQVPVKSSSGAMLPLGELGTFSTVPEEQPIYHKDLRRVVYAYAEMAGRAPAEAILDMQARLQDDPLPPDTQAEWAGEGEWQITLRVFRDLGLAFGAALIGIYILLILQTDSFGLPLLIMCAIPLTMLGIMPGFWLMNAFFAGESGGFADPIFFTATSMIGMIALGGIVIRNSLVLIEFVQDELRRGAPLREAVLNSGIVRLRPIVLTAATTALGAWPITLDPIFSGLAWALIFGLFASTAFTLLVIPVAYYALERKNAAQ